MGILLKKGKWLGVLIAILSYTYIIYRLFKYADQVSFSNFPKLGLYQWLCLIALQVFLGSLNILLESRKWQVLLTTIVNVKFLSSLKMILSGFASGIFTPAKIGEPLGRVMFLERVFRTKGTLLNYMGGILHNVVIFMVGLPALFFYWNALFKEEALTSISILIGIIIIISLLYVLWLSRTKLKNLLLRWQKYGKTIVDLWQFIRDVSVGIITKAIWLSLLRFIVYCLQLSFLLYFAVGQFSITLILLAPIYFMLITVIPSFFLTEIGIRGSVALFIFANMGISDVEIIAVVLLLWILNQVIPSIIGSTFILSKS